MLLKTNGVNAYKIIMKYLFISFVRYSPWSKTWQKCTAD